MIEIAGKQRQNDMSISKLNISDGEKLDLTEFVNEFGLKITNANDDNEGQYDIGNPHSTYIGDNKSVMEAGGGFMID